MHEMELLEGLRQADFAETLAEVEGQVDLLAFSPPYENARTYGADVAWVFEDYQRLGDAVKRALRPDGGQCLMVLDGPVRDYRGDGYTERSVMPWRVLLDWRDRLGLVVPDRLSYARNGQSGLFPQGFRNGWEPALWFATPGTRSMNQTAVGYTSVARSYRRAATGRAADGSSRPGRSPRTIPEIAAPSNDWYYHAVGPGNGGPTENENHPARFPYRLARDIVKCFSNPGDLVVDPFLGSGTTLIAALDHGRRFFGGDLLARPDDGELWIDIAERIARDRYAQRKLFEPPGTAPKVEQLTL